MHEGHRRVFLEIPIFWGIDLSITNEVVLVWIAGLVTFLLLFFACRRTGPVARGAFQNLFEAIIEFIDKEIVQGVVGHNQAFWSPIILTIFFFVSFCNLMGAIPVPFFFKPVTSNINVTAALALTVFIASQVADVWLHGVGGFFRRLAPSGLPAWILPLIVPLEIVARLSRPLSLTLRLFCNMMAGHMVMGIFIGSCVSAVWFVKPVPYLGAVAMSLFELFVCLLQAFVFAILSGFYFREAQEEAH